MRQSPDPHRGHRFPAEIIAHAVCLYHVFSLSLRDVELPLAERGVVVSHESIRRWCLKFGRSFRQAAPALPGPGDTWYRDEVFLRINGEQHYLWRAVDQHGVVLGILVQERKCCELLLQAPAEGIAVQTTPPDHRWFAKLRRDPVATAKKGTGMARAAC